MLPPRQWQGSTIAFSSALVAIWGKYQQGKEGSNLTCCFALLKAMLQLPGVQPIALANKAVGAALQLVSLMILLCELHAMMHLIPKIKSRRH